MDKFAKQELNSRVPLEHQTRTLDDAFVMFEIETNKTAKQIELDFKNGYSVVERDAIIEFGEAVGIELKKSYWINRLVETSMVNLGRHLNNPVFKLISGSKVRYIVVKSTDLTKMFNGKLYLGFKLKKQLQDKYQFDKIFTLYYGQDEVSSMYPDRPNHIDRIDAVWSESG